MITVSRNGKNIATYFCFFTISFTFVFKLNRLIIAGIWLKYGILFLKYIFWLASVTSFLYCVYSP